MPDEFFYETRSLLYDEFAFLTGKKELYLNTSLDTILRYLFLSCSERSSDFNSHTLPNLLSVTHDKNQLKIRLLWKPNVNNLVNLQ